MADLRTQDSIPVDWPALDNGTQYDDPSKPDWHGYMSGITCTECGAILQNVPLIKRTNWRDPAEYRIPLVCPNGHHFDFTMSVGRSPLVGTDDDGND